MNTLLINTAKIGKNSISAHTRNAIILSRDLGLPLISTSEEIKQLDRNRFDTFVIIGAAFYPKTAEIEAWIRQGDIKRIVWINNEYQVSPNSEYAKLIRQYPSTVISNVVEAANKCKGYDEFHHININALVLDNPDLRPVDKKYSLVYYGTYRADRRLYLQKYFSESGFFVSSSSKNLRRFHQLCGVNARFCDSLSWREKHESLNLFNYSLYIEDEFTHKNYNFLANRFYEALTCNTALLFDESCRATLIKSGYPIDDDFMVSSRKELEQKVLNFDAMRVIQKQRELWYDIAKQERKDVLECLSALLTSH